MLLGLVMLSPTRSAQAASAGWPAMFGDSAPTLASLHSDEAVVGKQFGAVRLYRLWGDPLFTADDLAMRDSGHVLFISVKAKRANGSVVKFADIAAAKPGSLLYNDMLSMVQQIKAFGARVYFIFNHEPEADASLGMGDGPAFVAAWRALVTTFKANGLTSFNVRFVLTVTSLAFTRTGTTRTIGAYYPGDAYVDAIGDDVYNAYTCRKAKWLELSSLIEPFRVWGLGHPTKQLMLMEWGSVEDPAQPGRKAQWIRNAEALFKTPAYSQFTALLYFTGRTPPAACAWDFLTSASATASFKALADDPAYGATA